ncbi:tetratricopeptide repeat protein, partial [Escherichia coli]|uniref:tetratricopeptide repeat protein n=1 Tax=Escherichia coli TaxID=562 RepID=UPI00164983D4
ELAGSIQLANGSLLKAERSFSKALSVQPDRLPVRLLLAQTEIRMGQAAKAVATLQPLVAAGNVPAVHALAGEAYL